MERRSILKVMGVAPFLPYLYLNQKDKEDRLEDQAIQIFTTRLKGKKENIYNIKTYFDTTFIKFKLIGFYTFGENSKGRCVGTIIDFKMENYLNMENITIEEILKFGDKITSKINKRMPINILCGM